MTSYLFRGSVPCVRLSLCVHTVREHILLKEHILGLGFAPELVCTHSLSFPLCLTNTHPLSLTNTHSFVPKLRTVGCCLVVMCGFVIGSLSELNFSYEGFFAGTHTFFVLLYLFIFLFIYVYFYFYFFVIGSLSELDFPYEGFVAGTHSLIHECVCTYTCVFVCPLARECVCVGVCVCVRIHMNVCVHMYVCIRTRTRTHTRTHARARALAHTHTHTGCVASLFMALYSTYVKIVLPCVHGSTW